MSAPENPAVFEAKRSKSMSSLGTAARPASNSLVRRTKSGGGIDKVRGSSGEPLTADDSLATEVIAKTVATRGLSATASRNQRRIAVT